MVISDEAASAGSKDLLKIKDFGNDSGYSSVEALQVALTGHYSGKHVSIVYPSKPNGLLRTVFVSVAADGSISHTYGDRSAIDFSVISNDILDCRHM